MNKSEWYCANIVFATFLCLNFVFLSATGAPLGVSGLLYRNRAVHDTSFGKELTINGRTVRCSGKAKNSSYPSPMYTCDGISVDGVKLYHGYSTEGNRNTDNCNAGCPCGTNRGHPNDIHALCSAMLEFHGVQESLVAAYVVDPSCTPDTKPERRVKLYYDDNKNLEWEDVLAPNGYINILQCLTENPSTKT